MTWARTYEKLPVRIQAIQWHDEISGRDILDWVTDGSQVTWVTAGGVISEITINTLEGDMNVSQGDWVIKGVNGEFYPCKPDIFEKTYKAVPSDCMGNPCLDHQPKEHSDGVYCENCGGQ